MTYPGSDTESALEEATPALFRDLGWRTVNAYHEVYADAPGGQRGPVYLGRTSRGDVILRRVRHPRQGPPRQAA